MKALTMHYSQGLQSFFIVPSDKIQKRNLPKRVWLTKGFLPDEPRGNNKQNDVAEAQGAIRFFVVQQNVVACVTKATNRVVNTITMLQPVSATRICQQGAYSDCVCLCRLCQLSIVLSYATSISISI